jgi:hypothetical protein
MALRKAETPPLVYARVAGMLYLVIIASGIFGEAFVRSALIVPGNANATAANILASEPLYRIGFAADALMLLCDVALAVLLYVLLRPVNKTLSLTAAAFRLTQAAILGFNLLNYYAALLLIGGAGYAAAFEPEQLRALGMLFLDLHGHGYDLGLLFFGVSNLILGYLVIRSGYFPALLGYALTAAAAVYLTGSLARFLFPNFLPLITPAYIVPFVAELSFALWLPVKGIRVRTQ